MLTIKNFTQGDTVKWDSELPAFLNTVHSLSWSIRGLVSLDVTAIAGNSPSNYFTTITSQQSGTLTPGRYYWSAIVTTTADGSRTTVATGQLTVKPNLSSVTGVYDGRSDSEKELDAVDLAISSIMANDGIKSYRINEREFTKQDLPDLIMWRDKLKIEVSREQSLQAIKQGLPDKRKIHSRFV